MKGGDVNPWNLVGMSSIRAATRKEKCLHPENWIETKGGGVLGPTKADWGQTCPSLVLTQAQLGV